MSDQKFFVERVCRRATAIQWDGKNINDIMDLLAGEGEYDCWIEDNRLVFARSESHQDKKYVDPEYYVGAYLDTEVSRNSIFVFAPFEMNERFLEIVQPRTISDVHPVPCRYRNSITNNEIVALQWTGKNFDDMQEFVQSRCQTASCDVLPEHPDRLILYTGMLRFMSNDPVICDVKKGDFVFAHLNNLYRIESGEYHMFVGDAALYIAE